MEEQKWKDQIENKQYNVDLNSSISIITLNLNTPIKSGTVSD